MRPRVHGWVYHHMPLFKSWYLPGLNQPQVRRVAQREVAHDRVGDKALPLLLSRYWLARLGDRPESARDLTCRHRNRCDAEHRLGRRTLLMRPSVFALDVEEQLSEKSAESLSFVGPHCPRLW